MKILSNKIKDQIHRTIHHVHKLKALVLWRCRFFLNYYQDSMNLIQSYSRVGVCIVIVLIPSCKQVVKLVWKCKGLKITNAEAEAPILWSPDAKSRLIGKDPDVGKDWRQKEKGTTEDEMIGLHHWFNGHEFEQTLGDSDGQGSLACCSPWGCKESDMTKQLNWLTKEAEQRALIYFTDRSIKW